MSVIVSWFNCFLLLFMSNSSRAAAVKKKVRVATTGTCTHALTTHLFSIVHDAALLLPALQRAQSTSLSSSSSPPTRFVAFICLLLLRRIGDATIAFALLVSLFYLCSSRVLIVFLYTHIYIWKRICMCARDLALILAVKQAWQVTRIHNRNRTRFSLTRVQANTHTHTCMCEYINAGMYIYRKKGQTANSSSSSSAAYEKQNINKAAENSWLTVQHVRAHSMYVCVRACVCVCEWVYEEGLAVKVFHSKQVALTIICAEFARSLAHALSFSLSHTFFLFWHMHVLVTAALLLLLPVNSC